MNRRPRGCALLLLLGVAACGAPGESLARTQWLQHTLVLDNQIFLDRDPQQAGGKLAIMGESLYPFFRGTAAQYARDAMQPGSPGYWPGAYESAETSDVALVGDPHPENIGTFATADGSALFLELNDFDGATFGPYGFDLRRLALGYWIATEQILRDLAASAPADDADRPTEAHRIAVARAVARGYADEIAIVAEDPAKARPMTADEGGPIVDDLVEDAVEDGDEREELGDYTRVEDGARAMFHGDVEPQRTVEYGAFTQAIYEDTVQPLDPREQALVESLLEQYVRTPMDGLTRDPAALRLRGTSRRLGSGVASYPALRFYALVEGASDAPDDDVLLEIKQVLDAVPMPALPRFPGQPFYTNAERVARMQQRLQSAPDADPWLGWASAGADGYRIRWRTGYQRAIRVTRLAEDLAEGKFTADDLVALAEASGRLLARRHGAAAKLDGRPGAPAIARAIDGDADGLVEEVAAFVEAYAPQVLEDHQALIELLEAHGPSLGYVRR